MENIENNQVTQELQPVQQLPPIKDKNIFKYLFIASIILLLGVIVGFYFLLNNKIKQLENKQIVEITPTTVPTIEETSPTIIPADSVKATSITNQPTAVTTTTASTPNTNQEIISAINLLNDPDITVTVRKVINNYATGDSGLRYGGSGDWIAVKINGIWRKVAEGQGEFDCNIVKQYQIPKEIYGNCYE